MAEDTFESALTVNAGIEQPPSVNQDAISRFLQKKRPKLSARDYVDGILAGDVSILSQAITLIESSLPEHAQMAQEIIEACLPHASRSIRIGITGVPGAGKSTFIEAMGKHLTSKGHRLAVLAVDPSSERSSGSILGDKTRMEALSVDPNAYIRPSPSAGSLGGVARKTRESAVLCEAAGYDILFIETVGVGQSETAVHSMTDFFLLIQISGAGDELQGIKRGIMEMADAIAINKADGDNIERATMAMALYKNALHLFPKSVSGWHPQVLTCSAFTSAGIPQVWETISKYMKLVKANGYFAYKRRSQARYWMSEFIDERLKQHFAHHPEVRKHKSALEQKVLEGEMSPFTAAAELLNAYFGD